MHRSASTCLSVLLAGTTLIAAPFQAFGADEEETYELDLGALVKTGTALWNQYGTNLVDWTSFTPEEIAGFWKTVETVLQSQSLEDVAWLRPAVQQAVTQLSTLESLRPYRDWLQQRLDYFEAADQVTHMLTPARVPPPPPPSTHRLLPPKRPTAPAAPPAVNRRRLEMLQDDQFWRRKIAGRTAPANARELVPVLKTVFRAQGMPPEWVWLAEVESSLNPLARSPVGAGGLYQLMPATAERLGLQLQPRDERFIAEKSASAAARYLKILYRQFRSWPLTLAAYNAGEGRIGKLLKKGGDKTWAGIAKDLPLETQMYVPKVLATVRAREGLDPAQLPPPSAALLLPDGLAVVARVFND